MYSMLISCSGVKFIYNLDCNEEVPINIAVTNCLDTCLVEMHNLQTICKSLDKKSKDC